MYVYFKVLKHIITKFNVCSLFDPDSSQQLKKINYETIGKI